MFRQLTPMVKNLLIVNIGLFAIGNFIRFDINGLFSFYGFSSPEFQPYQLFTHMFLHANLGHLFSNMIGLFFFGSMLEKFWGSNKFLTYYIVTGLGAGILYGAVNFYEYKQTEKAMYAYAEHPTPEGYFTFLRDNYPRFRGNEAILNIGEKFDESPKSQELAQTSVSAVKKITGWIRDTPMLGASGAIFGLIIAMAMLFPNTMLYLLFPPIPIKMKYFALFYGLYSIYSIVKAAPNDNVAHFAHLGGMLIGFIMIKIWDKDRKNFY